eukprot:9475100-Pyramimonas_sp.AAC.1
MCWGMPFEQLESGLLRWEFKDKKPTYRFGSPPALANSPIASDILERMLHGKAVVGCAPSDRFSHAGQGADVLECLHDMRAAGYVDCGSGEFSDTWALTSLGCKDLLMGQPL